MNETKSNALSEQTIESIEAKLQNKAEYWTGMYNFVKNGMKFLRNLVASLQKFDCQYSPKPSRILSLKLCTNNKLFIFS